MLSPYGEVLACPMLDKHVTGDLLEENLIDIWNNYKFKMVRKIVSYRLLPICEECCVQRRTLWAQLKAPANFKRVFLPRRLREFIYRYCKQSRKTNL
jgi:MoaA/NifB/PqqE/SkfB family radical SAM enzyme